MKLNSKVSLLAGTIALVGAVYMPQASATVTNLGTISSDYSVGLNNPASLTKGSFDDWVDFKVSSVASFVATGNSILTTVGGTQITAFNLYAGNAHDSSATPAYTGTINEILLGSNKAYATVVAGSPLQANQWYSVEVKGISNSNNGNYSLSLSTAPVPEPEEWAMMLVGAGLVSYQVRRKQKGLSQSSLG